jgi:hypothetical protein
MPEQILKNTKSQLIVNTILLLLESIFSIAGFACILIVLGFMIF